MTNFDYSRYLAGSLFSGFAHMKREYAIREAMKMVILPEDRERMEANRLLAEMHPKNLDFYVDLLQQGPTDWRWETSQSIFFHEEDHDVWHVFATGAPGTWDSEGCYSWPLKPGLVRITKWCAEAQSDTHSIVWVSHVEWDADNKVWDFCVNEF